MKRTDGTFDCVSFDVKAAARRAAKETGEYGVVGRVVVGWVFVLEFAEDGGRMSKRRVVDKCFACGAQAPFRDKVNASLRSAIFVAFW